METITESPDELAEAMAPFFDYELDDETEALDIPKEMMTIHYDQMVSCQYHSKYPGSLEQFAADYEEAYTKLTSLGKIHSNDEKWQKILTHLYDPSDPQSKLLVTYCQWNCKTFVDIIHHLTDTHVLDWFYDTQYSA